MSDTVNISANSKVIRYLIEGLERGQTLFALRGGRRAGKTYNCCIFLLLEIVRGKSVIFASMTAEQGRKGAYEDCKTIINSANLDSLLSVGKSPREIRCTSADEKGRHGVGYFASFADPETAKGGACDYVYINEANKFTYQQYLDLAANARIAVIVDFNPNEHFWIEDEVRSKGIEELVMTWKDNVKYLTDAQLAWFDNLKKRAESPDATAVDTYYYRVYYEGEYGELVGDVFTPYNLRFADEVGEGAKHYAIFCDPSALRGADYFACVLSCVCNNEVCIVDTYSVNQGTRENIVRQMLAWCKEYDVSELYVETNGIIGIDFIEFCSNSFRELNSRCPVRGWNSRGNKFNRIVANYQNLTTRVIFVRNERLNDFVKQVYEFSERCEHDDNIDAVNSSYMMQSFRFHF